MYATWRGHHVSVAHIFRNAAALLGAALVASWLMLFVVEAVRWQQWFPHIHSYRQALVLAAIFASYAIGWRHELVGAAICIVGTQVFFAVGYVSTEVFPPLPAVWIAAPGVLYLVAWFSGDHPRNTHESSRACPP